MELLALSGSDFGRLFSDWSAHDSSNIFSGLQDDYFTAQIEGGNSITVQPSLSSVPVIDNGYEAIPNNKLGQSPTTIGSCG
jgi:hypothetical protein